MVDLMAKNAFDNMLPVSHNGTLLTEFDSGHISSLTPYQGREKASTEALKNAHGIAFPAPGRTTGKSGCRAIWSGQGQALLIGPTADKSLVETTAITNQSDAWAVMLLEGDMAREVLARLCPLDLRANVFKRGFTARSLIGHMNASISRISAQGYLLMVFRSMAATAAHEISEAMKSVAAQ